MKSVQRYLDFVVAMMSCVLLISFWPHRDMVVRNAYSMATTDLGQIAQLYIVGFHNIETNEKDIPFRWGRRYVTFPVQLPHMKNNAAIVSFFGTTMTTQTVTLSIADRAPVPIIMRGSMFRHYHLLVDHTGINQQRVPFSFSTAEAQTINNRENGIALGKVNYVPLKFAFPQSIRQNIDHFSSLFGMLFFATMVLMLLARILTRPTIVNVVARIVSILSIVVTMYVTTNFQLSILIGALILLCAACMRPTLINVHHRLVRVATNYPRTVVYVLFVAVAMLHMGIDSKGTAGLENNATLCKINSYWRCTDINWNFATGDEPAYIKIAKNIKYTGTTMITYGQETTKKASVHSIGVSLLIVPTIVDTDLLLTRISFIFFNAILAILLYEVTGRITSTQYPPLSVAQRVGITSIVVLSMPFIPAANQLYPDLLAGMLMLGVWSWMQQDARPSLWFHLPFIAMVCFLPWLHTKYLYSTLAIAPVIGYILFRRQSLPIVLAFVGSYSTSVALVVWYGIIAWGNPFGPINQGSAPLTVTGLSRLFGLIFDQNQGILWQNPLLVLGLFGVGMFYRRDPKLFWVWGWMFGAPLIVNSLHTNAYGGISYSGRFQWSSTVMLAAVTMTMLIWMMMHRPLLTKRIMGASMMLQSYFWYMYSTQTMLYPRVLDDNLVTGTYTIMYGALEPYLPTFYSLAVTLATPANYVWVGVICTTVVYVNYRMRNQNLVATPQIGDTPSR